MVQSGVYSWSQESWQEIPGYPGYEASTQGHIRNKHTGRVLSASPNNKGYLLTTLSLKHTAHRALVHRLVMLAFVGASDLQVNHKDGDKTNNHLSNLEYTTCKQNIEHAMTQLGVRYGGDRRQIARRNGD